MSPELFSKPLTQIREIAQRFSKNASRIVGGRDKGDIKISILDGGRRSRTMLALSRELGPRQMKVGFESP